MKVHFFFTMKYLFLDLRIENEIKSWSLKVSCNSADWKEEASKKIKPLTGFEPVPPRYLLAATISSTSTDRIILKIFLKNVVYKGKFTFSFKNSFAIYQKSDFNRSKSHLNSPFMEFFSLHKTTFLVAAHTGDQLNFIATQPKPSDSSPLPAQAINDDNHELLTWAFLLRSLYRPSHKYKL